MKKNKQLGVFVFAMMNVAIVMSLRGLPLMAKEGLSMIFYVLFASFLFLIPVSLVSAELATGWPKDGGVYRWVKEAFGSKLGFTAIWLQWIQNTIWYTTVLAFAAGALSYVFLDPTLAANKFFIILVGMQLIITGKIFYDSIVIKINKRITQPIHKKTIMRNKDDSTGKFS